MHISVSIQGCLHYLYTLDDTLPKVEGIEMIRLLLYTSHFVDLIDSFSLSSFTQNLMCLSNVVKSCYSCTFGNIKVNILLK